MLSTSDLDPHERLLIARRRDGVSQADAATAFGMSAWEYRLAEAGRRPVPRIKLGRLAPHEACFLMRRRAGMQRKFLAAKLRVSPFWLTQMERGKVNATRLIDHWS